MPAILDWFQTSNVTVLGQCILAGTILLFGLGTILASFLVGSIDLQRESRRSGMPPVETQGDLRSGRLSRSHFSGRRIELIEHIFVGIYAPFPIPMFACKFRDGTAPIA